MIDQRFVRDGSSWQIRCVSLKLKEEPAEDFQASNQIFAQKFYIAQDWSAGSWRLTQTVTLTTIEGSSEAQKIDDLMT